MLVLPSHREGFGVVIIEAAAMGIPSIGSRIYGISDALLDRETGLLFEKGNSSSLAQAMVTLIENPKLRAQYGLAALARVQAKFQQGTVLNAFLAYYKKLLERFLL